MKSRIWMKLAIICLAAGWAWTAQAVPYYVNDAYDPVNDVYTTAGGNNDNTGTTPGSPKATLGNLIGTVSLAAGDVVYIDTGTYAPTVISNTVVGTAGNPILFQGSTNLTAGGTVLLNR